MIPHLLGCYNRYTKECVDSPDGTYQEAITIFLTLLQVFAPVFEVERLQFVCTGTDDLCSFTADNDRLAGYW